MLRLVPIALFVAVVVGCSKKNNPTGTGDGTDPNATYEIKFRDAQKGEKYDIVKSRHATSTTKTPNSNQTKKDESRYEYTETILATAPDEPRPTKVSRVYKIAEKSEMPPASYIGKTVTIEKYLKGYKFAADGKSIPALEMKDISEDFHRGGKKAEVWLPQAAVKIGEEWSLNIDAVLGVVGAPPFKYQRDQSKMTAKLVRAYKKDDQQWGEIKVNATIMIDTTNEPGPKLKGQIDSELTFDAVIDGSARAGTLKMTTKGEVKYRDPFGGEVTWTVDGTQEESITPVK
jgi:hypothetical protein